MVVEAVTLLSLLVLEREWAPVLEEASLRCADSPLTLVRCCWHCEDTRCDVVVHSCADANAVLHPKNCWFTSTLGFTH